MSKNTTIIEFYSPSGSLGLLPLSVAVNVPDAMQKMSLWSLILTSISLLYVATESLIGYIDSGSVRALWWPGNTLFFLLMALGLQGSFHWYLKNTAILGRYGLKQLKTSSEADFFLWMTYHKQDTAKKFRRAQWGIYLALAGLFYSLLMRHSEMMDYLISLGLLGTLVVFQQQWCVLSLWYRSHEQRLRFMTTQG